MKIREAQKFSDITVDILTNERIKQNISRYKLAQSCNLTEAALSYIERHERRPTLYTLKMLVDALNLNLTDIISKAEKEFKSTQP